MEKSKNPIFIFVLLLMVGLAIFFMPNISEFVSGLKNGNRNKIQTSENKNLNNSIPSTYNCTVVSYSDTSINENITKNVIFNISNKGEVTKFTLTKTSAFDNKTNYDNYKKQINNEQSAGVKIITSSDDKNLVFTEKIEKDLTKMESKNNLEYPTNYSDLKKFLSEEGYSCSK